jgi:hypothetical protein
MINGPNGIKAGASLDSFKSTYLERLAVTRFLG